MKGTFALFLCLLLHTGFSQHNGLLVIQTDFGTKDGAVAAMKGVALTVDSDLRIFDLTHEIPPFNIWEGAYRLNQAAAYWPVRTVFVSVVDPGVGSTRKSIVLLTKKGRLYVSPDNGSLTLIAESEGIEAVREIDESVNRLPGSSDSYTFHGRDVYVYVAARLASGRIKFTEVGPLLQGDIVRLPYQRAEIVGKEIHGTIDVLDVQYGNVWSNISSAMVSRAGIVYGDQVRVRISNKDVVVYDQSILFGRTFADVPKGQPIGYLNSLSNFAVGLNQDDFAKSRGVQSGFDWKISVQKVTLKK